MKEMNKNAPPKKNRERLMPQAPEAENAILHEMIYNNPVIPEIANILTAEDFYFPRNGHLFTACTQLHTRQCPVDIVSLMEELKRMEVFDDIGGYEFIAQIATSAFNLQKAEYYAKIVKQKSVSRKLIQICLNTAQSCFDESKDIADVLEELEIEFTRLTGIVDHADALSMDEAVDMTIQQIRKACEDFRKGIRSGIPTHLPSLTEAYGGGFKAPELIILGARPSMGKTQHALEMAFSAGINGCNTLFCSLEMSTPQLVKRLLLRDERISDFHINNGQMNEEEFVSLDESAGAIRPAKIYFADHYSIRNLSNIKKTARLLKRKANISFLVIDYLGLVKTGLKFAMRQQEIAYITGELKALAKELDIAVLLLCQLSRPLKGMQVKIPVMEDLRESGDIEQDADTILLLHKPDFYDKDAEDKDGVSWKDRGMMIRAKYREGERNVPFVFAHDRRYKKVFDYVPDPKEIGSFSAWKNKQEKTSGNNEQPQTNFLNQMNDEQID